MNIPEQIEDELRQFATEEKRKFLPHFFKTGKGEYGEGDKFLGVMVPEIRKIAINNKDISLDDIGSLMDSEYHECRMCGLLILVAKMKKQDETTQKKYVDFYLSCTSRINNWDLVDLSCKDILGLYLTGKSDRSILYKLASSSLLWDQRIAVVSTFAFIRRNDFKDILVLSEKLIEHPHDLMHKAIGWMLREVGKKDKDTLCLFLDKHHKRMPRTMLRYSIEKLTTDERIRYMKK